MREAGAPKGDVVFPEKSRLGPDVAEVDITQGGEDPDRTLSTEEFAELRERQARAKADRAAQDAYAEAERGGDEAVRKKLNEKKV